MLLAGDIGGTKTRLAVFTHDSGLSAPIMEASYPSCQYPDLETILNEYLLGINTSIKAAVLGVAGPVSNGKVTITNLPWIIDEIQLQHTLNLPLDCIKVINDLEAVALSLPNLRPTDIHTLNEGNADPIGNIAVIAPGTGLGEAFLTWDGKRYQAHACEGGHSDFAPTNPTEIKLLNYLLDQFGHVCYEKVCSGKGIYNIYQFLKESGYAEEQPWLAKQLSQVEDPTPVIANIAVDDKERSTLCSATISAFISILGSEAGNLALKVMATGGVYLGGGIPPKIRPILSGHEFMRTFSNKGCMAYLMPKIPVHIILNTNAAILGAASYGTHLLDIESRKT